MRTSHKPTQTGVLIPAPAPQRTSVGVRQDSDVFVFTGGGTSKNPSNTPAGRAGLWLTRWQSWRKGFEQSIGAQVRRYWSLYRAFDNYPVPGPGSEWRDRTVIPTCFKIIESLVPRTVSGLFGNKEWFTVEGTEASDEQYEEMVKTLMQRAFDEIGNADPQQDTFLKRFIDGERYRQIVGHVFFKLWWRRENMWLKTQMPVVGADGVQTGWKPIEALSTIYDNIDFTWLPLDSIAIDLSGARHWVVERIQTSVEALKYENTVYEKEHKQPLYKNLDLLELEAMPAMQRDGHEEPRDTEHWPLTDEQVTGPPGEKSVELWLCWDNVERTLTKIVNRNVEIAHGMAPTPDGLDPYISVPGVPVPNRVYGDSILHWVGPLATYQTRIARARADEVLLNIWQQYVYKEGSVRTTQFLFRPGGAISIDQTNPDKPVSDAFAILPRRPVYPEAFTEEQGRQIQAESTAGADSVSQGAEATSKSRDVSATEIQQRVLQGSGRSQLVVLYLEACFKKPLLNKTFDLLRQNLTKAKTIRVLGETMQVDLTMLERPIDINVGGGLQELSTGERLQETQEMIELGASPVYGPWLKPREILLERLETRKRKNTARFVKTEEEKKLEEQRQMAMAMAAQGAGSPRKVAGPGQSTQAEPGAPSPGGGSAEGGLAGASGQSPQSPPAGQQSSVEYV